MKAATLYTGGGGADIGITQAGFEMAWGVEKNEAIANHFQLNFPDTKIINDDIKNVNPETLEKVDYIHASPPCQKYSSARRNAKEDCLEQDAGLNIIKFIEIIQPQFFSLENVPLYRNFFPFHNIVACLHKLGYWTHWGVCNAFDYGVSQNRNRLILRASKSGFFLEMLRQERRGWYLTIKDLIPNLPKSKLADWQAKIIAETTNRPLLIPRAGTNCKSCSGRQAHQPSPTIRAFQKWRGSHWADVITAKDLVLKVDGRATARLMGFPDTYQLASGSLGQVILGNAVCPPVSYAIAKSFT